MCGICGKLALDREAKVSPSLIKAMADAIVHRGPDDEGFYISGQVGLGFRRLSIIDLSGGHQPLSNEDKSIWIVFNGEIYNYQELRVFLLSKGHVFSTHSDTEVIVHLYEEFGEACIEQLRGMFAFAIWDSREDTLLIARDRVGIKPLYYTLTKDSLVFGSEIKAILADPSVKVEVDPAIIDRFLTFDYTPGNETLFKGIYKLAPGSYMLVRNGKVEIKKYWDLHFFESNLSLPDAENQLMEMLEESVRLHMISDVPVGFLLSGGLDSTAMLSLAVAKTQNRISSFTVGFSDVGITDERPFARLAAETFGTDHHEITISNQDFADFVPKYVWHMEEPVCEPPAIALYFVSKLAKDHVKVLISGEGGDEAFAGYPNYRSTLWLERIKTALGPAKASLRGVIALADILTGSSKFKKYLPMVDLPFSSYYYSRTSSPSRFFNSHFLELYSTDFAKFVNKQKSVLPVTELMKQNLPISLLNKMLYVDTKTWLPDDLLIKADKITMANSIELRVPLLDHKLLEFAASLPVNYKLRGFTTKYIAKKTLSKRVPEAIVKRKKTGFPVPYESWLRNDLKNWLSGILLDRETIARGYFEKNAIERLIANDQQFGGFSKELFSLAVLEIWHREFLGGTRGSAVKPPQLHTVVSDGDSASRM
jgi:asparagine synthase (glutamine-hydrolysing)